MSEEQQEAVEQGNGELSATEREAINREVWGDDGESYVDPQPQDVEPAEQETKEDPWAGVPAALRESIESISSRVRDIDTIHERLKQAERRIGGAEMRLHEAKIAANKVQDKPTAAQLEKAKLSEASWNALREDFPEWADAMDDIRNEFAGKTANLEQRISELNAGDEITSKIEKIKQEFEIRLVDRAHTGWRETVKSPEYTDWLKKQPAEIINKTQSPSADDAIEVLDLFTEYRAKNKRPEEIIQQRKRTLESAAANNRRSGPQIKQKSVADMTEDELRQAAYASVYKE